MARAKKAAAPKRSRAAKKAVLQKIVHDLKKIAAHVSDAPMVPFMVQNMKVFGDYTVEDRALPDYRDSLKPGQRRALYAMWDLNLKSSGKPTKSAKIVGKIIGDYHPHGDTSAYGTMVNMANQVDAKGKVTHRKVPVHLIEGQGNWGTWEDPPASMRYTECRLSKFSDTLLLNNEYMHPDVIDMVPNYLNTCTEPVLAPALVPLIMLNGAYGIAVGVTTNIPPFEAKGVMALVKKGLGGAKITVKDCLQHLHIKYAYGAEVITAESDLKGLYDTGKGRVTFQCKVIKDIKKRTLYIVGLTPDFVWDKSTDKKEIGKAYKIRADDHVRSALNEGAERDDPHGLRLSITLKDSVPAKDVEAHMDRIIKKYLRQRETFVVNVTVRNYNPNDGEPVVDKDFKSLSIVELLNRWIKWRVKLELKMLRHKRDTLLTQLHRLEVLRLAVAKIDIVMKVLKSKADDLDKALAKALKIPESDAKIILDMATRRLSRLSDSKVAAEMAAIRKEVSTIKKHIKKPEAKIAADMDKLDMKNW